MANELPGAAELEHLLIQLLRMLSPAFTLGDAGAPPGPADGQATGSRPAPGQPGNGQAGNGQGAGDQASDLSPVPAVSASEARALIELVSARGIAQGELAGMLGLDKSTVSRLAAGLERKGWIRRGRDQANQRYVRLYLTPAGGEVAGRVWQAWRSRQARILAELSADERAGLVAGLGGLVRSLGAETRLGDVASNGS